MKKILYILAISCTFTALIISQENNIIKSQQEQVSTNYHSLQHLPVELKQEIANLFINEIIYSYKPQIEHKENYTKQKVENYKIQKVNKKTLEFNKSSLKNISLINKNFSKIVNKKFIEILLKKIRKEKLVKLFKNAWKINEFKFINFLLLVNGKDSKTVQASDVFDQSLENLLVNTILKGQNDIISDIELNQIKIFLKMGADVNVPLNSKEHSILQLAVGIKDMSRDINSFGPASFFIGSENNIIINYNTMSYPFKKGHYLKFIIKELLKAGAKVNNQDPNTGDTALHIAAKKNRREIVNILLEFGGDPNIKNKAGITCIDITK